MSSLRSALLCAVLTVAAPLAFSSTNLVANGDFETGTFGGWTRSGLSADQWVGPDFSATPLANDSNLVFSEGAILGFGVIGQLIATSNGAHYILEFDLQRPDSSGGAIDNESQVLFGGAQVFHEVNTSGDWTHYTLALQAQGGSSWLQFGNRNYWDYTQIDNVSLVLSAVPEPGSALMLAGGLGLLALARRRRRAAS